MIDGYGESEVYLSEAEEVPPAPPADATLSAEEQAAQNTQELLDATKNGDEPPPVETTEPLPTEGEPVAAAPADDYNPWVSTSTTAYATSDSTAAEIAQANTAAYMDGQSKGDVSPDVMKQAMDLQAPPEDAEKGLTALEKTVQELAKDSVQTTKKGNAAAEEQAQAAESAEQSGSATAKKVYTDAERQLLSASAVKRVDGLKALLKEETNRKLRKDYTERLTEASRLLTQTRKADAKKATATLYRPSETEQGEMGQQKIGQNIRDALRKALGGGKFSTYNQTVPDVDQEPVSPEEKLAYTHKANDEGHVDPDLNPEQQAELGECLPEESEPNQLADNNQDAAEVQDQNTGATQSFNPSSPVSEQAVIAQLRKDFAEGKSKFTQAQIDQIAARMEASAETTVNPDSDLGMLVFGGTGGVDESFGERAMWVSAWEHSKGGVSRKTQREREEQLASRVGTGRARLTTTSPDAVGAGEAGETRVAVSDRSREDNDAAWNQTTKKGKKDDFVPDDANQAYRASVNPRHWKSKGNIITMLFGSGSVLKPNLSVSTKDTLPHLSDRC